MRSSCSIKFSKKHQCFCILLSLLFFNLVDSHAKEEKIPVLLLEPSFLHLPLSCLISGAQRTVIVPGFLKKNKSGIETISFLEPGWKTLRQEPMDHFVETACKNLSQRLTQLHPKFLRDEHQVIQVATIESADPITASIILAPNFAEQFIPIFGTEFLIAIPSANHIYIFSKLVSPIEKIATAIRDDYHLSLSPVSTEIFELGHGELRAIGSLD